MRLSIGNNTKDYHIDEHVYIPKNSKHRIENATDKIAALIEIQTGDYFGEDDIIRYEDDYNR
jgi:mannose-6-phosphate isomerase-like protein (cupin superfamily)